MRQPKKDSVLVAQFIKKGFTRDEATTLARNMLKLLDLNKEVLEIMEANLAILKKPKSERVKTILSN